jgi:hypothetical protein
MKIPLSRSACYSLQPPNQSMKPTAGRRTGIASAKLIRPAPFQQKCLRPAIIRLPQFLNEENLRLLYRARTRLRKCGYFCHRWQGLDSNGAAIGSRIIRYQACSR